MFLLPRVKLLLFLNMWTEIKFTHSKTWNHQINSRKFFILGSRSGNWNPSPCSAIAADYCARLNGINIGMIFSFLTHAILQRKANGGFHIVVQSAWCTPRCPDGNINMTSLCRSTSEDYCADSQAGSKGRRNHWKREIHHGFCGEEKCSVLQVPVRGTCLCPKPKPLAKADG